jgi:hypothetical protein
MHLFHRWLGTTRGGRSSRSEGRGDDSIKIGLNARAGSLIAFGKRFETIGGIVDGLLGMKC